jgi:FlaA1/EpsC-like NDP-sugar epimerase
MALPNPRALLAFAHDVVAAGVVWCAAFWLRFNLDIPPEFQQVMLARLPYVVAVHVVVFWALGLYRGLWRYASLPDLQRILIAVGVGALAVLALLSFLRVAGAVPRSVFLIAPVLLVGAMSGSRLLYRAWKEGGLMHVVARPESIPVLVLGAGDAAALLLQDLANSRAWRVLGLLDDDARKKGGAIAGVKVIGTLDKVGEIAERLGVTQAIIAMPGATHAVRKRAVDLCVAAGITVMTVPALSDIVSGKVSVSALRNIELDDLLGRDAVALDLPGLEGFLKGKTVLVTGAGGSIGSELCRQIARFAPARLVLFDHSEFALYTIAQEFRDLRGAAEIVPVIGDAKDAQRLAEVFARWRPEVIFHAAAYKHVPLMETENAFEAVRNNVLGTLNVARAAAASGAQKFVLISTDKAVNPTNVMGASKRVAELVCQALQPGCATQFVIVRFGNVLGSTGSVVPRFREQIARGGPVTVTHPEIRRYFMTIPEAAQLVLQAGQMGKAGEIYVLDMGEPVKIVDLARQMIRLSGFAESDIKIEFTGLRPGEKLYEEMLADAERTLPTPRAKLRIAKAGGTADGALIREVTGWLEGRGAAADDAVREQLKKWVPEYAVPAQAV